MSEAAAPKLKTSKFKILLLLCFLSIVAVCGYLEHNKATIDKLPALQNGDLVFQTQKSSQDLAIMYATSSLYSHMGIIKISSDGEPHVIEAIGPVREVPLSRWIRQGIAGQLTVKRIKNLPPAIAEKMLSQAEKLFGKPYDIFFTFGDDRIYCSELVYDSLKGTGMSLGKVQKVSELNMDNFAVEKLIEKRWQSYPPCKNLPNKNLDECKKVIMEQTLITPKSIAEDPKLETIYSNYTLKE